MADHVSHTINIACGTQASYEEKLDKLNNYEAPEGFVLEVLDANETTKTIEYQITTDI